MNLRINVSNDVPKWSIIFLTGIHINTKPKDWKKSNVFQKINKDRLFKELVLGHRKEFKMDHKNIFQLCFQKYSTWIHSNVCQKYGWIAPSKCLWMFWKKSIDMIIMTDTKQTMFLKDPVTAKLIVHDVIQIEFLRQKATIICTCEYVSIKFNYFFYFDHIYIFLAKEL